jgi:hypothetical protein
VLVAPLSALQIAGAVELTLTPNLSPGQPVGTTVEWTAQGIGIGPFDYRLSVNGRIMYDYGTRSVFDWTPLKEGSYLITVAVRDDGDDSVAQVSQPFRIVPVPGSAQSPVLSDTRNPLVALYSAPECTPGLFMRVTFRGAYAGARQYRTDAKPCAAGKTMNFYVAGMRASTLHLVRHLIETSAGQVVQTGPLKSYATGIVDIRVPTANIVIPVGSDTSVEDSLVLCGPIIGAGFNPVAADLDGQTVWYYKPPPGSEFRYLTRWNDGGTFFAIGESPAADRLVVREVDLAGNTIRETNSRRIAEQLEDRGGQIISVIHHEVARLPDGNIAVLGSNERLLEDVQGPGLVDVIGDEIIVLDDNMQIIWSTNLFDILDVTRLATGNEKCIEGILGCPILLLAPVANDWTHANSIAYTPADGNLIVSLRNQDYVIKVDYRNGVGSGGLIWRLGKEGDFTPLGFPGGIDPWFTHQHDANYVGTTGVVLFDNGNRNDACLADRDDCVSRGQFWTLDEANRTATLETNADLESYNSAVGSAQKLSNGNYNFNNGVPAGYVVELSRQDEVRPDGTKVFSMEFDARVYRGYRLRDLYTAPSYD